ncbi:MAG: GNAT family N-acetyltransferase [Verrucomicrobiaceae bacterium]|nr:MAG: GNAT family N-acetyltransferase [Verrucomicrobiaceae bacterium]
MFSRQLTDQTSISLSVPQFAEELFDLTDRNRLFLRKWLPWLDRVRTVEDTRSFLDRQLQRFAKGESLHVTIFHEGKVAGVAGFNSIDHDTRIGYIGYWLGEEFNGRGIMTAVVRDLIVIGRDYHSLQKVDIRCATGNARSRAIPGRLGFSHEGTLRRAERVNDDWYDHDVYGLLIDSDLRL